MGTALSAAGLAGALAPLFSDPAVPAPMKDAGALSEAAAWTASLADPDLSLSGAAIAAVSPLPGELKIPGALLFMSGRGASWRSARAGRTVRGSGPAMAGGVPSMGAIKLSRVLELFAWHAAEAAVTGEDGRGGERGAALSLWEDRGTSPDDELEMPAWLVGPTWGDVDGATARKKVPTSRIPDFSVGAGELAHLAFGGFRRVPAAHAASVQASWRAAGRPFEAACASMADAGFAADFLGKCAGAPQSLRLPLLAAMLAGRTASGATDSRYAWAVCESLGEGLRPGGTGAEGRGEGRRSAAERLQVDYPISREYAFRGEIATRQDPGARLDPSFAALGSENFLPDGTPREPAALARAILGEADAFPFVEDRGDVGLEGLVLAVAGALDASGWGAVPRADCVAAAKASGLLLGADAGKFASYLAQAGAAGGGTLSCRGFVRHPFSWDAGGEAESLCAEFMGGEAGSAGDVRARAVAWVPSYNPPAWVIRVRDVAGLPRMPRASAARDDRDVPPLHPGAVLVVKAALALSKAGPVLMEGTLALLGPEGRLAAGRVVLPAAAG